MALKTDSNQTAIVDAFRRLGYSVLDLHTVGKGCTDILVAKHGLISLCEIKTKNEKLNERQSHFVQTWNAKVFIIKDIDDVIEFDNNNS